VVSSEWLVVAKYHSTTPPLYQSHLLGASLRMGNHKPNSVLVRAIDIDYDAKTYEVTVVAVEDKVAEAETTTETAGIVCPTASTNNIPLFRRRIFGIPIIGTPLMDIPSHVIKFIAVWLKTLDGRSPFPYIFAAGSFIIRVIVMILTSSP